MSQCEPKIGDAVILKAHKGRLAKAISACVLMAVISVKRWPQSNGVELYSVECYWFDVNHQIQEKSFDTRCLHFIEE